MMILGRSMTVDSLERTDFETTAQQMTAALVRLDWFGAAVTLLAAIGGFGIAVALGLSWPVVVTLVILSIAAGYLVDAFIDHAHRRRPLELLAWLAERLPGSTTVADATGDPGLAEQRYAEAYQRYVDTGELSLDDWRRSIESLADWDARDFHVAMLSFLTAVARYRAGDARWREALADGRAGLRSADLTFRTKVRVAYLRFARSIGLLALASVWVLAYAIVVGW